MASNDLAPDRLAPAEFCRLERALVAAMTMRKKRRVEMGPMQHVKLQLLDLVEQADPPAEGFSAALGEAILACSPNGATGPAQAVASDIALDWQLACTSPGFVAWLRQAASTASGRSG